MKAYGSVDMGWSHWRAGRFDAAQEQAERLVDADESTPEALHLLTLTRAVLGDLIGAISCCRAIPTSYRRLTELDEPMLWAQGHSGDLPGADDFARRRGLSRRREVAVRLEQALDHPPRIRLTGTDVAELPFTDDPLTPFMPGFAGRLNGHDVVFRLDTGGSFLHLDTDTAHSCGIAPVPAGKQYAALSRHRVGYGRADLDLGPMHGRNVPVTVHDDALPVAPFAAAFGVPLGPIIGTNLLRPFLTTIDGPEHRLLLSDRTDLDARSRHLTQLPDPTTLVRYGLWDEHRMIALADIGAHSEVPLFIDSGLVMVTPDQGQAAVLAPRRSLRAWGVADPRPGAITGLPRIGLGPLGRQHLTALPVSARTWRQFGDWGGIDVQGLLSWGYLRHYTWTIDPLHQQFRLS